MPMMDTYLMKLLNRRHIVSPRAPNTLASKRSSCWTSMVITMTTHAIMRHAVMANTFRPRSQLPPRMWANTESGGNTASLNSTATHTASAKMDTSTLITVSTRCSAVLSPHPSDR